MVTRPHPWMVYRCTTGNSKSVLAASCSNISHDSQITSMATFNLYSNLDQQQTVFEVTLPSQHLPPSPSPPQDPMTDYRSNNSMLFFSDTCSAYSHQTSFLSPSEHVAPVDDQCFMSTVPGSISSTDIKTECPGNSFFFYIRQMVVSECQQTLFPSSLVQFSSHQPDVTSRETVLITRLRRLEQTTGDKVKDLISLFRHHSAGIEMERVHMLSMENTHHYRDWLNSHFDQQRHQVMDRVERSLQLLEQRAESEKKERDLAAGVRQRTTLTRRSIQLMESWYRDHQEHPYPSATVVEALSRSGNINTEQVRKWFANKRIRNCNTRSLTEIAKKKHQAKLRIKSVQVSLEHDLLN